MQTKGSMSGQAAAGFRSKAGQAAADKSFYASAADKAAAGNATMGKAAEQAGYAQAMKQAPGATPEVQQAYDTYAKLATANKAIPRAEKGGSMSAVDLLKSFLKPSGALPAIAGAATGHPILGAAAGLAARAATTAPVQSSLAKALIPAGQTLAKPQVSQSLGGLLRAKMSPTQPARPGEEQR